MMEKITDLWESASTDLTSHEGNTYGLYYDYESDYKGDYTLSIAIEGKNESAITIPEDAKYEIFRVDTNSSEGVLNMW